MYSCVPQMVVARSCSPSPSRSFQWDPKSLARPKSVKQMCPSCPSRIFSLKKYEKRRIRERERLAEYTQTPRNDYMQFTTLTVSSLDVRFPVDASDRLPKSFPPNKRRHPFLKRCPPCPISKTAPLQPRNP
jgi:hypothetical protein